MREIKLLSLLTVVIFVTNFISCTNEDKPVESEFTTTTLAGDIFNATREKTIFDSEAACQTYIRTAEGYDHNFNSHLHYDAAVNIA